MFDVQENSRKVLILQINNVIIKMLWFGSRQWLGAVVRSQHLHQLWLFVGVLSFLLTRRGSSCLNILTRIQRCHSQLKPFLNHPQIDFSKVYDAKPSEAINPDVQGGTKLLKLHLLFQELCKVIKVSGSCWGGCNVQQNNVHDVEHSFTRGRPQK